MATNKDVQTFSIDYVVARTSDLGGMEFRTIRVIGELTVAAEVEGGFSSEVLTPEEWRRAKTLLVCEMTQAQLMAP